MVINTQYAKKKVWPFNTLYCMAQWRGGPLFSTAPFKDITHSVMASVKVILRAISLQVRVLIMELME